MVDSVQVFPPSFRVLDDSGDPVANAKIKFREIGPGDELEVYSDAALTTSLGHTVRTRSDGYPCASQGSNTTVMVYVGASSYHVEITDENDVALFPAKDNVRGALNTTTFLTTADGATISFLCESVVSDTTVGTTHNGKMLTCDPTSLGLIALTFDQATTLEDGFNCELRNNSTTGYVRVQATQVFHGPWGSRNAFTLMPGESFLVRCDGSAFHLSGYSPSRIKDAIGTILIKDMVAVTPTSPAAGERWIATGIFTSGGVTTAVGDIIEATGFGTFIKYTPTSNCGWRAWVQDEQLEYVYRGSAWAAETASSTVPGTTKISTQAIMETATATDVAVLVGHQKNHPAHIKHWAMFSGGAAAIANSFGNSSVVKNAVGSYTFGFSTAFSASTTYTASGQARGAGTTDPAGLFGLISGDTKTTTSIQVRCWNGETDNAYDSSEISFKTMGDQ